MSVPDGGTVGGHSAFGAGIVHREFCDGIDNDGDGRVDERVLNRCGEAGDLQPTLWRLLDVNGKGPSDPRLSTLEALAAELEVDVVDLLREPT